MNKAFEKYMDDITDAFPTMTKREKTFLENFKKHLLEYCDTVDEISYEILLDKFGSPTEIFDAYFETLEHEDVNKLVKTRGQFKKIVIGFLIVIVMVGVFFIYRFNELYKQGKNEIIESSETTIIDYGEE